MFSLLVACCVCDVRLKINDNNGYFAMDCTKFESYYFYDTDKQQNVMLNTYCDRLNIHISYNMLLKDKIRNMQAGINSITTDYASLKSALLSEFANQINVLEDYNTFYELDKNTIVQSAINNDCTLTEQEDIDYISNEIGSWVDSYNALIKCNYDSDFSTCISYINNEKEEQPSEPEITYIDNETFYGFVDNIHEILNESKYNIEETFNRLNTIMFTIKEQLDKHIQDSKQPSEPQQTPSVEQIIKPIEVNNNHVSKLSFNIWNSILTIFVVNLCWNHQCYNHNEIITRSN